ncbi:MAG: insulinase family protein [Clostridia bacterium]|nr:insulinase family protein [Clostridia bacterium]
MKIKKIGNIGLLSVPDSKFKNFKVALSFATLRGKEYATKNSLLLKVLLSGCEKYPTKKDINIALKKLYGSSISAANVKVRFNLCPKIEIDALCDKYCGENLLTKVFELISEIIFKPLVKNNAFDSEIFERERGVLASDIAGVINDKRQYALLKCLEITCGDDPYGATGVGDLEVLKTVSPESLYEHYKYIIKNTAVTVTAVGSFDEEALIREVQNIQNKFGSGKISDGDILKASAVAEEVKEKSDITQGKLVMAFTTDVGVSGDDTGESVLNGLFGGGVSSKLFNIVREKMSLCYYASSSYDKNKGIILAQAGIDFENYEKTTKAILDQLTDIQNGNFTDEEFENVKKGLINNAVSAADDIDLVAGYYNGVALDDEITTLPELAEKYGKVKREQIIKLSRLIKLKTTYFLCGGGAGIDE